MFSNEPTTTSAPRIVHTGVQVAKQLEGGLMLCGAGLPQHTNRELLCHAMPATSRGPHRAINNTIRYVLPAPAFDSTHRISTQLHSTDESSPPRLARRNGVPASDLIERLELLIAAYVPRTHRCGPDQRLLLGHSGPSMVAYCI